MRVKMPRGFVVYRWRTLFLPVNNAVSMGDTIHYRGGSIEILAGDIIPPTPVVNNNHAHAPH